MQFSLAADRILGGFFDPEGWKKVAQTSAQTLRERGEITCEETLACSLCPKGLSANLCHMEELGAQLRVASTKRRRRERRGRTERKSKGRGTTSVTPRTGGKTGTSVTEGTSRSITGWIGPGASART